MSDSLAVAKVKAARRREATDAIINDAHGAVAVAVSLSGWATVSKRGDLTPEQRRVIADGLMSVAREMTRGLPATVLR